MDDTRSADDELEDKRKKALLREAKKAKRIVDWINDMPAAEDIVAAMMLSTMAERQARGEDGVSENEIQKLGDWVMGRCVDMSLISGIIRAHICVRWDDPTNQPAFRLTERGAKRAEELKRNPENN